MTAPLTRARLALTLIAIAALTLCAVVASLCIGSTSYRPWQLWDGNPDAALVRDVVFSLRLPRTLAALAVGGLLAFAGTLQQILLRNPLADPYVLGTAGGASVAALLALLLGMGAGALALPAGIGALLTTLIVFALAGRDHSTRQTRLLLTGIALASFCGALSSLLLSLAPDGLLRGMLFWLLGDLAGAHWRLAAISLALLLALVWPFARDLNLLSHGMQSAHALGVDPRRLRWLLYLVASAATAVAVTTAGVIGFIGLIVPNALRIALGHDTRLLLPASALTGGAVLLIADIVSRVILAPQQLPVGVITALAGVPLFLWLLQHRGVQR
ncbi:FecCD family ABC transporter permease [Andreprevotia chitinilytica]|uniref:FecCD family ABC transporter permease n=1 Tax=Andreprevotia chitinilytica TaxID=396808 RepID=UPI00054EA7BA|nr:iron ABC transporter permease [Andreprevotia chitinilytica]